MQIDILSLFPELFSGFLDQPPFRFAIRDGLVRVRVHIFCQWVGAGGSVVASVWTDHGVTSVIRREPVAACLRSVILPDRSSRTIVLSPGGRCFNQVMTTELSRLDQLVLVCGRFGGFEAGLAERIEADEVAIGEYVLTGGELAAMVVTDCVLRQLPGVIGGESGIASEANSC